MRVYIAGPYTKPDPIVNTRKAVEAAEALILAGHDPYIPHLTMLWHLICPHELEFWYAHDLRWLEVCDVVYRLPGKSTGADGEVAHAEKVGMDVFYAIEDIPVVTTT